MISDNMSINVNKYSQLLLIDKLLLQFDKLLLLIDKSHFAGK